jgi:hypothetical protein
MEGPGYTYHDHHDNHNSDTTIWTVTLELSITLLGVKEYTRSVIRDVHSTGISYDHRHLRL